MGRRSQDVQSTISQKLQTLPASKQVEVLDFVDYLASLTKAIALSHTFDGSEEARKTLAGL